MLDRLAAAWRYVCSLDPGSIRSVIWCLVGILGMDRGDTALTNIAATVIVVIGLVSALMPTKTLAIAVPGTMTITPEAGGTANAPTEMSIVKAPAIVIAADAPA